MGKAFSSEYDGRCSVCGEKYYEDDMIRKDPDENGYCHDECFEGDGLKEVHYGGPTGRAH